MRADHLARKEPLEVKRRHFIAAAAAGAAFSAAPRSPRAAEAPRPLSLKYAIPTGFFNVTDDKKARPLRDRLALIAEEGFKAVENNGLASLVKKDGDLADVERYGRDLEAAGLEQATWVTNNGPDGGGAGLVRREEHEAFLACVERTIRIAPLVKGTFSTVCVGNVVEGMSRDEGTKNCIEGFKRAAELLDRSGSPVVLVLEPLNVLVDHKGYFCPTSEHAYEIVKGVGHPKVKILFDIYHQQITEGNLIRNMRAYYDEIAYFQFGDNPGRNEPGTGEINYRNVFKAIRDLGFQGFVGAEHGRSRPGDAGSRAALAAIREADTFPEA